MQNMLYCYFGHHKCASTWLVQLVHDISSVRGLSVFEKQISLMPEPMKEIGGADFYINQNSIYSKNKLLKNYKGFHVIRDPRDIIVSGYFSHLYSHPTDGWDSLLKHRIALIDANKEEGLFKEIDFSAYFIDHIYSWNYNDPNILELKMEDLTQEPKENIRKVLQFLNLYTNKKISIRVYKTISFLNRILRKIRFPFKIPIKFNDNYIQYIV